MAHLFFSYVVPILIFLGLLLIAELLGQIGDYVDRSHTA